MRKISTFFFFLLIIIFHIDLKGQELLIESPGFFIDHITVENWEGHWELGSKHYYGYDEQNRKSQVWFELWNTISDTFEKSDSTVRYYNSNNKVSNMFHWNRNGNSWSYRSNHEYIYNTEAKVLSETVKKWNGSGWEDSVLYTFSYDGNGYIAFELQQKWEGSLWVNERRITYTTNSDGTLAEELHEYWQSGWNFSMRYTYTYNLSGKLTVKLYELHNGTSWNNYANFIFTYEDDLISSIVTQEWTGIIWQDEFKIAHSYNTDESVKISLRQEWISGSWIDQAKLTYLYTTPVATIDLSALPKSFQIHPNPFTENIQVDFFEENIPVELKMYNQQGKMVKQLTINSSRNTIPMADLPAGCYYAIITSENKTENKKLVKVE